MSTEKRSVEPAEEGGPSAKTAKVENGSGAGFTKVYSLMCLQPNYRNGGSLSSFEIFTTLEAALQAKRNFVVEYAYDDLRFSDAEEDDEHDDENDKKPLYDHNSCVHEGVHGYDKEYIYCEVEGIDLTKPPRENGAVFYTRLNC